jgi:hypothetical protein
VRKEKSREKAIIFRAIVKVMDKYEQSDFLIEDTTEG